MEEDYMLDLEKAMEDAPGPVQAMVRVEELKPLIPAVLQVQQIKGGAAIRLRMKKWQPYLYWLLLVASAMVLTNHVFAHGEDNYAVPRDKIAAALVKFTIFLCAVFLMVRTMKQMM